MWHTRSQRVYATNFFRIPLESVILLLDQEALSKDFMMFFYWFILCVNIFMSTNACAFSWLGSVVDADYKEAFAAFRFQRTPKVDPEEAFAAKLQAMDRERATRNSRRRVPVSVERLFYLHSSWRTPLQLKEALPKHDWCEIASLANGSEAAWRLVWLVKYNLEDSLAQPAEAAPEAQPVQAARGFVQSRKTYIDSLPLYIIAAYLFQTVPVKIVWSKQDRSTPEERTVLVPRAYPSGIHILDIRWAVAKSLGVPHFVLDGTVESDDYLPHSILTTPQEPGRLMKFRPIKPLIFLSPPEKKLTVRLSQDTGRSILSSWGCCCTNRHFCGQQAYLYVLPESDALAFCTATKDESNLQTLLQHVLASRYTSCAAQFLCKDCSRQIHPKWRVGNFFESEYEMSTLFNPDYCGCYKEKRTWPRSIVAKLSQQEG